MDKHYFNPSAGKYNFEDAKAFKELPGTLREGRWYFKPERYHPLRSLGINAYFHCVVIPYFAGEYYGEQVLNKEGRASKLIEKEMKKLICEEHLRFPLPGCPGHFYTRATSSLNGMEFWNLLLEPCFKTFEESYHGSIPPPEKRGYKSKEETYNDKKVT